MNAPLADKIDEFLCLYNEIKDEIRQKDKWFYERWKAGGFLVDEDIISMYPHIGQFVEDDETIEE